MDVVSCSVNRSLVASSATGDRETPPLVAWSATGEVPWEREKEPRQVTRRGFFASRPKVGDQRTSHRHRELNPREPRVARHITTLNPDLLARLGDVAQDWDLARRDLARPIQRALIEWWELYWRAYMHGVFGPTGKQWGSQLQPPKAPEG